MSASIVEKTLSPAYPPILWWAIVVLVSAFYLIEHRNSEVSSLNDYTISGPEMVDRASEGDLARRMAIPALAMFGVLLMLRGDSKRLMIDSRLTWLLLAYLVWCSVSVLWSPEPMLTLRHIIVFVFCSVAALGVAKSFSPRQLCLVALCVSGLLVANSVRTEVTLGTFRPLSLEYRFAGALHPNVQAPYCALLAVTAGCLASQGGRASALLWTVCLAGIVLLLLTKSRTVCGVCLAAFLVYLSVGVPWQRRVIVGCAAICVICTAVYVGALFGVELGQRTASVATIGRTEDALALTGRLPLWTELKPFLAERPLIGYGYQTFWDPNRIGNFSHAAQWTVTDGHSAYLDTSLDLGLPGLALFVLIILAAISTSKRRFLQSADVGYGFLVALISCRAAMAFTESGFSSPTTFVSFVMACGILCLICEPTACESNGDLPEEDPAWQPQ